MGRKSRPQPAPSNANEAPGVSGRYARRREKEPRQFPENEGLASGRPREADALGGVEGEALEEARAASQRGRTA